MLSTAPSNNVGMNTQLSISISIWGTVRSPRAVDAQAKIARTVAMTKTSPENRKLSSPFSKATPVLKRIVSSVDFENTLERLWPRGSLPDRMLPVKRRILRTNQSRAESVDPAAA